jgi:hypothetical protein
LVCVSSKWIVHFHGSGPRSLATVYRFPRYSIWNQFAGTQIVRWNTSRRSGTFGRQTLARKITAWARRPGPEEPNRQQEPSRQRLDFRSAAFSISAAAMPGSVVDRAKFKSVFACCVKYCLPIPMTHTINYWPLRGAGNILFRAKMWIMQPGWPPGACRSRTVAATNSRKARRESSSFEPRRSFF